MRLFIALQLNEACREAISEAIDTMRAQGIRANYVPEDNLHVTLAFLGEVEAGSVPAIEDAICSVPYSPLTLTIGGIGNFGHLLYVGMEDNPGLRKYVSMLRQALDEHGIDYDRKKFKAHITIARKVESKGAFHLHVKTAEVTVNGVSLMRSDRVNGGMRYTEIGYFS